MARSAANTIHGTRPDTGADVDTAAPLGCVGGVDQDVHEHLLELLSVYGDRVGGAELGRDLQALVLDLFQLLAGEEHEFLV